jgi:aryl-alcohol dehydrogenase-like predicted oxidoreductase
LSKSCSRQGGALSHALGGVPIGNEFEVVTDEDAMKTLEASWTAGIRYFDVSPWYGLGLAERRYGTFLHNQDRKAPIGFQTAPQTYCSRQRQPVQG